VEAYDVIVGVCWWMGERRPVAHLRDVCRGLGLAI